MAAGHAIAPRVRGGVALRSGVLVLGLATCASGIVAIYESRLGLSPWDVLNQGVAEHTPLSLGTANILIALVILLLARRLDVRLRAGTVTNAILLGGFVDLFLRAGWADRLSHQPLGLRIAMLAAGILAIGLGTAIYLGAGMGAGPRDSLMLGITSRVRSRVGVVRTGLEVSATAAGFALGGTVGIGTLAFALGIGPAVELCFWLLRRSPLSVRDGHTAPPHRPALESG